jgi:SpoVK/Ycf46/Vps4 family AAA+-type ATPase
LEGDGGALARVGEALKGLMGAHKGLVALSAAGEVEPLVAALGGVPSVRIEAPGQAAQEDMWRSAAAQLRRELPEASVAALAAGLSVTPGAIARAVRGAEEEGALDGEALGEQLARAARATMSHELEKLAERVEAGLRWEDAVLPDELREAVQEVIAHARHREQVLKGWGFGDKLPYGRGLSCLLSGPPGTGKTMLAGLLARSLGRPLYRVDVSRLVSKWLGETEKNLAALFREAARAQAILLFDEADSLFAKRTEVKSSQDRHANLEVNFLLQQMESFDGVTILTTNLDKGIDEAFLRRLRFRLHVGTPNEAERARLWRAMIPARAPLAGDVSFEALARALPLSGGHIKNAVVRAAFRAAAEGSALTHDLLYDAAAAEARENGMLVRA